MTKHQADLLGRLEQQVKKTEEADARTKPLYAQVEDMKARVSTLKKSYQDLSDALEFAQVENDKLREERDALAVKLKDAERRTEALEAKLAAANAAEAKAA